MGLLKPASDSPPPMAHNFLGFVQLACLVMLFKRF
jgi:hypothetical protein